MNILETERLILRTWEEGDLPRLYEMNQDPKVMEYFPGLIDRDATQHFVAKAEEHFSEHGFSYYAADSKSDNLFIGFIGLGTVAFDAPFTPAVEIGWRLAAHY